MKTEYLTKSALDHLPEEERQGLEWDEVKQCYKRKLEQVYEDSENSEELIREKLKQKIIEEGFHSGIRSPRTGAIGQERMSP